MIKLPSKKEEERKKQLRQHNARTQTIALPI